MRGSITNWKSYRSAGRGAAALLLFTLGLITLAGWDSFRSTDNVAERAIQTFFVFLFAAGILSFCARKWLKPFLAWWIHSPNCRLTFTANEVRKGMFRFPRAYKGEPLSIEFRINRDAEADRRAYAGNIDGPTRHILGNSRVIEIVVRGSHLDRMVFAGGAVGPGKSQVVAEVIGDEQAEKFAAVCRTALELTASSPDGDGVSPAVDLDAVL